MKYLKVWQYFYPILILGISAEISAKGFSILARKVVHESGIKEFTISKEIKSNNCSCACSCAPRKYDGELSLPEAPILTEKSSTQVQYFKIKKEIRKNKCSCSCACLPISSGRTTIQTSSSPPAIITDSTKITKPSNDVEENKDHLQSTTKLIEELLAGTTSLVDVASTRSTYDASTSTTLITESASARVSTSTNEIHQTETSPLISTLISTIETTHVPTNSETTEEQLTTANTETTFQSISSTLAGDAKNTSDSTSPATLSHIFKAKVANLLNRLKSELMRLHHESSTTPSTTDSNGISPSSDKATEKPEIVITENKTKSDDAMRSSLMKTKFLLEDLKHKVELLRAEANNDEISKSISIVDQMERKHFNQKTETVVPRTTTAASSTTATTTNENTTVLTTLTTKTDPYTATPNDAIGQTTTETKVSTPEEQTTTVDADAVEVQKNLSNQLESAKRLLNNLKEKVNRLKVVNQSQSEVENTLSSDKPTTAGKTKNYAMTTLEPSTEEDGNTVSFGAITEGGSTQFAQLSSSVKSITHEVRTTHEVSTTAKSSTDDVSTVTEPSTTVSATESTTTVEPSTTTEEDDGDQEQTTADDNDQEEKETKAENEAEDETTTAIVTTTSTSSTTDLTESETETSKTTAPNTTPSTAASVVDGESEGTEQTNQFTQSIPTIITTESTNPTTDSITTITTKTEAPALVTRVAPITTEAPTVEQTTKLMSTTSENSHRFAFVTEAPETTILPITESTIQITTPNVHTTIDDTTKSTSISGTTEADNPSTSTDSKIDNATKSANIMGITMTDITTTKESPIVHMLLTRIPAKNSESPAEIPTTPAWITDGSTTLSTMTPKIPVESSIDEKIQQKTRILLRPVLSDLFKMMPSTTSPTTTTTTEIITSTTTQVDEDSIQNLENNLANRLEQARQLREEQRQLEMLNALRRESTADTETAQEIHQRRKAIEARLVQLAQAERWHRELIQRYQLRQRALANAAAKREDDVTTHTESTPAAVTASAEATNKAVRVSCEPIRKFIATFRVRDPIAWLKDNCEVVKQLHPTANCAQIQQLMSGCI